MLFFRHVCVYWIKLINFKFNYPPTKDLSRKNSTGWIKNVCSERIIRASYIGLMKAFLMMGVNSRKLNGCHIFLNLIRKLGLYTKLVNFISIQNQRMIVIPWNIVGVWLRLNPYTL